MEVTAANEARPRHEDAEDSAISTGQDSVTWAVTAPFLTDPSHRWISSFAETDRHDFVIVPKIGGEISWHSKKVARTGLGEWRDFARTSTAALRMASSVNGGVVTVFPQLAASAASRKKLRRLDVPLVAWFFNTNFGNDARTALARRTLDAVDRFVVHSSREIEAYAEELRLPAERFEFVPVQYGGTVQTDEEDTEDPFVFATGSGFRDYGTFFDAMALLPMKAKVVAGPRVLAGLTPPTNVEILEGLNRSDIHHLVRQARVNVIPMHEGGLTGGIITFAETFRHGRGVVVSDRPGIDDYVHHDDNALIVPMRDATAMADAIDGMWNDEALRSRLAAGALHWATENATDQAAARSLVRVLDGVLAER